MKNLIAILAAAVFLGSCAAPQQISQFKPVSLTTSTRHVESSQSHIKSSQTAAARLANECAQKNAGWQEAYTQLNDQLTAAYNDAQIAKEQLGEKQKEINDQTADANKVVVERNQAVAKVAVEHARGNKWMKYSLFEGLLLLGALAWITKGIWLKALVALMLMTATLQGNIGDTPEQFKARFVNSQFSLIEDKKLTDYVIGVTNRDFYCAAGFKNGLSVIESWIANPPEAGIPDEAKYRILSPYGVDFTVVRREPDRVGAVSFDGRYFVIVGRTEGIEYIVISDADYIKTESSKVKIRYVPPMTPAPSPEPNEPTDTF